MKRIVTILFCGLFLTACQNSQKQQPTESEIEQMVNERVEAQLASGNLETTEPSQASSYDNGDSELASKKKYYFEQGRWSGAYDKYHATTEKLKEEFKQKSNGHDPADMGNKDLFEEYLRGYEEGQRQRNQL